MYLPIFHISRLERRSDRMFAALASVLFCSEGVTIEVSKVIVPMHVSEKKFRMHQELKPASAKFSLRILHQRFSLLGDIASPERDPSKLIIFRTSQRSDNCNINRDRDLEPHFDYEVNRKQFFLTTQLQAQATCQH